MPRFCDRDKLERTSALLNALRTFRNELEFIGHSAEFGKRAGLHLSHEAAAVYFYRRLSNADIAGNLFAQTTPADLSHDLLFARGESF